MAMAAGISLDVKPSATTVIPDSEISLSARDLNGNKSAQLRDCSSWMAARPDHPTASGKLRIPADVPINIPVSRHLYEPNALGLEIDTRCTVETAGAKFNLDRIIRVDVAPPIQIDAISNSPIVTTPASDGKCGFHAVDFKLRLTNHLNDSATGEINRFSTIGPIVGRGNATRRIALRPGETTETAFAVDGCELSKAQGGITFMLSNTRSKVTPALLVPVIVANAQVAPNLRVGYIRGFDFSLPNALNALGVESKELSIDDVKTADLSKFTSVIVDNRVYESKPELIAVNQKLLDYAQAGGNLIVFYHKSDEWNPDERRNRPQLAPYKLILGGERVTDENAPITFLEPDHPLLNTPNKMGQDDFKDWIQERGLYYPKEWDPQFHALLQSNDPGEQPLKGGLLVAEYGKGHYIYTSMVWYRELRGGIPGAYRMLATMISYGR
jgi:hypothetical protein